MKPLTGWFLLVCALQRLPSPAAELPQETQHRSALASHRPTVPPATARYVHVHAEGLPDAVVKNLSIAWAGVEQTTTGAFQWLLLDATKVNGTGFRVWLLTRGYPAETREGALQQIDRFILQQGSAQPHDFSDRVTGAAVLPSLGGWPHLFPRPIGSEHQDARSGEFPPQVRYLGHTYRLQGINQSSAVAYPVKAKRFQLRPDRLVGLPSNTRQKDETRRYDGAEYEFVRLQHEDYREMAEAGMNCFRVDAEQLPFVEDLDVFYWGPSAAERSFPECLYDSRYLGPALFLDEPAVHTRDYVLRPRLAKEQSFRHAITPALAFEAFREYFRHAWQEGAATSLGRGLAGRPDIDLGDMRVFQENLYSWETMISTAAFQLSQHDQVPAALVFEPPGRVGTRRTLPEINMTYGCQIPVENPNYFIDIIYGFLRGAARLTGKQWGTSIYGAVDRADAFWFLTRAYDLGATRFFFWDNAQLACVPYQESLALARALKMRAENYPSRDLERLKHAAEVAILLPAGYNLGHVYLGKGNLWGLGELHLERVNSSGVTYRSVMGNFFTEVERCLRLGIGFDVLGEFPKMEPTGYREVIRIREDGRIEVSEGGQRVILDRPRKPVRPAGSPPALSVTVSRHEGPSPLAVVAQAMVTETSAPVFYTLGTDSDGIYQNAAVAWELYGPTDADHRVLTPPRYKPRLTRTGNSIQTSMELKLERPGEYRLRAATVDLAGRSTIVWTPLTVR